MQTALIALPCVIAILIIWYVNLLDFFQPKDLRPNVDLDLVAWDKEKENTWTKHS